uniref:Uncharacterized protein n=1 Tax=Oryza meridionalis TaxID=40149 RepID=A0A0E0ENQ1_9ORYZ
MAATEEEHLLGLGGIPAVLLRRRRRNRRAVGVGSLIGGRGAACACEPWIAAFGWKGKTRGFRAFRGLYFRCRWIPHLLTISHLRLF